MVDSNLQREKILPSERTYAYKMNITDINKGSKNLSKDIKSKKANYEEKNQKEKTINKDVYTNKNDVSENLHLSNN